jgi:WD40 repeat protein
VTYGYPGSVAEVAWSADSQRLATAGSDGIVRVWAPSTAGADGSLTPLAALTVSALKSGVAAVALSADGGRVLASGGGGVAGWDIRPGASDEVVSAASVRYYGDVAFAPDGLSLVAADEAGRVVWRALDGGAPFRTLAPEVHEHWFALSPDGAAIALSAGGPLTVWSSTTGRLLFESAITDAEFDWSPDGTRLLVGDTMLDLTGRVVGRLDIDGFRVREPRYSADGRLVALTGDWGASDVEDGVPGVVVWNFDENRSVTSIDTASLDAVFDPSGTRLATTGMERDKPAVWDVASGRRLFELAGTGLVLDVAFSPDGKRLATAGFDGMVRLFEAATGRELAVLSAGPTAVRTVVFSPDGRMLAAHRVGEVRVWALDIDLLLEIARERVTRSLSEDECRQFLHLDRCPPPA